jgi:hypothetical protein
MNPSNLISYEIYLTPNGVSGHWNKLDSLPFLCIYDLECSHGTGYELVDATLWCAPVCVGCRSRIPLTYWAVGDICCRLRVSVFLFSRNIKVLWGEMCLLSRAGFQLRRILLQIG